MLEAVIPYLELPEKTLFTIPGIGPLKLQVFGPLVAIGVIVGMRRCLHYAKKRDIDEWLTRDLMFWALVVGFVVSHWVSVLFYFPDQVEENPWVLLMIWNGLSSVGGFFGGFLGAYWFARRQKQPPLIFFDILIFGLLIGFTFGRLGCALVHDHPGAWVDASHPLAVGPWPGTGERYRLDLGLIEFLYLVPVTLFVHFIWNWKDAAPGRLTGLLCLLYAPFRLYLDTLRGAQDPRYFGLTTAQYFTIAMFLVGVYLYFIRKPKPEDMQWSRDSERIAAAKKKAEASKDVLKEPAAEPAK